MRATYIRRRFVVVLSVVTCVLVGVMIAPAIAPPIDTPYERLFVDAKEPEVVVTTTYETDSSSLFLGLLCPDVVEAAYALGWHFDDLDELDYVVWRESRCLPHVHFDGDPNGGSHGLMQINGFWCQPSRYHANGWLQGQGLVSSCEDLYNPIVNLLAGQAIFNYSSANNGNGWQPWAMPENFCASPPKAELCVLSWGGKGGG